MFNDKYGLTTAVLDGRKTMTRRVMNIQPPNEGCHISFLIDSTDGKDEKYAGRAAWIYEGCQITDFLKHYTVGEVIAIAQSYKDMGVTFLPCSFKKSVKWGNPQSLPGWNNKMFVRADACKRHIKITEIKAERLQDISDEDCLKEGIVKQGVLSDDSPFLYAYDAYKNGSDGYFASRWFNTPREAFAVLIDKVSGKGTWESNPFVWIYEFELVD